MDSMKTNTCLRVRDHGQPLPPGLLLRKAPGSPAWLPSPRMGAAPLVPTCLGWAVPCPHLTGGKSRPQSGLAPQPGHQPQGDGAALLCPAEGLPGTELPELENGCPGPAGRPQECSISRLGVGEGQGRPALGALDSNNRGSTK